MYDGPHVTHPGRRSEVDLEYVAQVKKQGATWSITFPAAPGCTAQASSRAEVPAAAKEAVEGWLEGWLAQGKVPPVHPQPASGLTVAVDLPLAVAVELRRARIAARLTQEQVATRAGVSQQQVALLERPRRNPSLRTIKRVADAIGVRAVVSLVAA